MPQGSKGEKRPADVIGSALRVMESSPYKKRGAENSN
jgi:hypothetical protein